MAGEPGYVLDGLAVPASIDELHSLLARAGAENPDVSAADLMMFETAVIEIAANVVEHGRPSGEVSYCFRLHVLDDRLEACLSDSGEEPCDMPVTAELPHEMSERGRGLALAEAALDQLVYQRCEDRNVWRMVRLRN